MVLAHLFIKVPRPRDSKGTFSVLRVKLLPERLPVYTQR